MKEGDIIGRLIVAEFKDSESNPFDEIMEILNKYSKSLKYEVSYMSAISFPSLEIFPDCRKVYGAGKEILLTAKEFDILYLLADHEGLVLTYAQIYRNVWGDYDQNIQNNSIGSHVCSLREKLYAAVEKPNFRIRCVREVGYCFEIKKEKLTETV